jgi:hypothetical protein
MTRIPKVEMNTGATSEQSTVPSTVWSRFWSWLSPAKAVAPVEAPVPVAETAPAPAAPVPVAETAPAPEASVEEAPKEPTPAAPESGKTIQIPLESTPLAVETLNNQTSIAEQPNKNDIYEEQPNQSAFSAKSQSKKKKRH